MTQALAMQSLIETIVLLFRPSEDTLIEKTLEKKEIGEMILGHRIEDDIQENYIIEWFINLISPNCQ